MEVEGSTEARAQDLHADSMHYKWSYTDLLSLRYFQLSNMHRAVGKKSGTEFTLN